MGFELTILGSSSATPIYNRHPTSQLLIIRDHHFLIDCGEGTLTQLLNYRVKYHKITHIFISHLHGDHYLGLVGLISTFHLQGRTSDLHIYGQQELMDIIEIQLRISNMHLRYNLIFHSIRHYAPEVVFEDEEVMVRSVVLNHRVPCTGFIFKEKPRPRKLRIDKLQEHNIPFTYFNKLRKGEDFRTYNGEVIPNKELTEEPSPSRAYAYCSDTIFDIGIADEVKGVDLLYHEATFLHDQQERAAATFHSTCIQAAEIAKKGEVSKLIIGHFSARYRDLQPLLLEAKTVFENTELALEGRKFKVD